MAVSHSAGGLACCSRRRKGNCGAEACSPVGCCAVEVFDALADAAQPNRRQRATLSPPANAKINRNLYTVGINVDFMHAPLAPGVLMDCKSVQENFGIMEI